MLPNSRNVKLLAVLALAALATAGCQKLQARDMLNKGVAAYKNGSYDLAIDNFKKAKELDPTLLNARLYLATAYASQYIPGASSEENIKRGNDAIAEYQEVLQMDPQNLNAIDGLGSILFSMGGQPFNADKMKESRSYHEKHIQMKPGDPEPYYWVGVIDWTLAYRANNQARADWNKDAPAKKQVKDDQPLPDKVREKLVAEQGATVDDGIRALQKAIDIDPMYENAMAYLNLLYRQKADHVTTAEERQKFLDEADKLVDKVKEIKQKKAEEAIKKPS